MRPSCPKEGRGGGKDDAGVDECVLGMAGHDEGNAPGSGGHYEGGLAGY